MAGRMDVHEGVQLRTSGPSRAAAALARGVAVKVNGDGDGLVACAADDDVPVGVTWEQAAEGYVPDVVQSGRTLVQLKSGETPSVGDPATLSATGLIIVGTDMATGVILGVFASEATDNTALLDVRIAVNAAA